MGFFDDFEGTAGGGGASYLDKEEKAAVIKSGAVLNVTRAWSFTDAGDYPGPAYGIAFELDGEERAITFKRVDKDGKGVESRDEMIAAFIDYLDDPEHEGETIAVVLAKEGRSYVLRDANEGT